MVKYMEQEYAYEKFLANFLKEKEVKPTPQNEVKPIMKIEEVTIGLPLLGYRFILNPEKYSPTNEFYQKYAGMSGTIINANGIITSTKRIINKIIKGTYVSGWVVSVLFDDGYENKIDLAKMIPLHNAHKTITKVELNSGKVLTIIEGINEDQLTKEVIQNRDQVFLKIVIDNEYREKIFKEAHY
jgi:hypothetical protein